MFEIDLKFEYERLKPIDALYLSDHVKQIMAKIPHIKGTDRRIYVGFDSELKVSYYRLTQKKYTTQFSGGILKESLANIIYYQKDLENPEVNFKEEVPTGIFLGVSYMSLETALRLSYDIDKLLAQPLLKENAVSRGIGVDAGVDRLDYDIQDWDNEMNFNFKKYPSDDPIFDKPAPIKT